MNSTLPALTASASPVVFPPKGPHAGHTYGQILKSTALIGGSSAVNVLFGMVRTKVMGPASGSLRRRTDGTLWDDC